MIIDGFFHTYKIKEEAITGARQDHKCRGRRVHKWKVVKEVNINIRVIKHRIRCSTPSRPETGRPIWLFFTGLRINTKNLLLQKVYSFDKNIPEITAFYFSLIVWCLDNCSVNLNALYGIFYELSVKTSKCKLSCKRAECTVCDVLPKMWNLEEGGQRKTI